MVFRLYAKYDICLKKFEIIYRLEIIREGYLSQTIQEVVGIIYYFFQIHSKDGFSPE